MISFSSAHIQLTVVEPIGNFIYHLRKIYILKNIAFCGKIIKIKFLQGLLKEKEFNFDSNKIQKIRIGRNKKNEIFYDDMTLSRIHCT